VPEVQVTATDLAATLRALADENGAKARELAALNHPHLAAWYQGQREAYLKVIAMVEGVTDERLLPEQRTNQPN
jgi:hypothetical protein